MLPLAITLTLNLSGLAQMLITVAAVVTAVGILGRLSPVKWVMNTLFYKPITQWFRREVGEVVDERLDARPILNGKGTETIEKVEAIAQALEVDVSNNEDV